MSARDIRVGAFVLGSLLMLAVLIFIFGGESDLFAPHTEMKTSFKDVQGLARGSPVRMGGVDIGRVTNVGYTPDAHKDEIVVTMLINADQTVRIRKDSVASIAGRGMLGDKMITITVGSLTEPVLSSEELIPSKPTTDILEMVQDLKQVTSQIEKVANNLEKTTAMLAEDELHDDIRGTIDHLNGVLASLDKGEGYIGKLISDPSEAKSLSDTIAGVRRSAAELEQLLRSTRLVVDQIRSGPGLVHEVLYGTESEKAVAQFGGAAEELGLALRGIREGKSFAHGMLYDDKSGEIVDNLNQATADFRDIARDIKSGKGTVGALLTDPSVYEDLKLLLGNVGRNRSLRALVRYSINQDERAGRVGDSADSAPAN
ncbi:MAG: hypothetical protein B6A08_01650 [Sorangiineae bacterium NIC37A_2]|jgi:phospholipid/cholesterol/gamma-HCH transport system substrate-binding protein|nr:MAG: hypothetical protein B6A08_01650 [Sorangiineae bacterium NIC37A_2]